MIKTKTNPKIAIYTKDENIFNSIRRYLHFVCTCDAESIVNYKEEKKLISNNDKGYENIIFELDNCYEDNNKDELNSKLSLLRFLSGNEAKELNILFFSSYDKNNFYSDQQNEKSSVDFFFGKCIKEYNDTDFLKENFVSSLELPEKLKDFAEQIKENKVKQIENIYKNTYNILEDFSPGFKPGEKEEILRRVSQIDYDTCDDITREKARKGSFHGAKDNEEKLLMQMLADLLVEKMYFEKHICNGKKTMNILWLENNPDGEINLSVKDKEGNNWKSKSALKWTMEHFPGSDIYLRKDEFDDLFQKIGESEGKDFKIDKLEKFNNRKNDRNIKINEIDFLIFDVYLGEDKDGDDFVELFTKRYPEIPILILSGSEDFDLVEKCLDKGADFYLNKKFIFSLPLFLHRVYNKYGKLIWLNAGDTYKRKLLGRVRYWMHHKDFLWYGDKCYHMIDHGFKHTYDNWKHTNQLLPIVLENIKSFNLQNAKKKSPIEEHEIYSFSLAMWLHDIGHKGNENYSEAYQIRDNHSFISGELVINNPELFKIIENGDNKYDTYYKKIKFPHGPCKVPVSQFIMERPEYDSDAKLFDKGLSNLERVALFCIYHKSNAPLTRKGGVEMLSSGRFIPKEFFINSDNTKGNLVTMEDILNNRLNGDNAEGEKQKILSLMTLFRFIDGLDIHDVRVGDITEKDLKLHVINQDKRYYLKKLKEEVDYICEKIAGDSPALALQIYTQLYQIPVEKIGKGEFKVDSQYREFVEKQIGKIDNYWMILNYAQFISVQDGHFDLHSCVKDINIQTRFDNQKNADLINIIYTINNEIDLKWLTKTKVREMRVEPMSILEKLFGDKDKKLLPYTLNELKESAEYLEDYLNLKEGLFVTLHVPANKPTDKETKKLVEDLKLSDAQEDKAEVLTFVRKFKLENCALKISDLKDKKDNPISK
jgi:CheY-like chemotaxis protein